MEERWKTIPGFSRYQASNTGKIRSINYKNSGKIKELKPAIDSQYLKTMILNDENKYKTIRVHKIICLTFLGEYNLEVNHIDGNKLNNNLNNLEYCTHSENLIHAFKTGLATPLKGMKNTSAKLNDDQIKEIRDYAKVHGKLKNRKELSLKYKVTEAHLKDIVSGRRGIWSHI